MDEIALKVYHIKNMCKISLGWTGLSSCTIKNLLSKCHVFLLFEFEKMLESLFFKSLSPKCKDPDC